MFLNDREINIEWQQRQVSEVTYHYLSAHIFVSIIYYNFHPKITPSAELSPPKRPFEQYVGIFFASFSRLCFSHIMKVCFTGIDF